MTEFARKMSLIASVIAVVLSAICVYKLTVSTAPQLSMERDVLEGILAKLNERERLIAELSAAGFSEREKGIAEAFLAKIRKDGVAAHLDEKRKIDALAGNTLALDSLIEAYLPKARTPEFRGEAQAFRTYRSTWATRWNSVFEYYMVGGDPPPYHSVVPSKISDSAKAELASM